MLEGLLALAVGLHRRVTLNVRADNPAVRVYERLGFVTIDEIVNRVGTRSVKMVRAVGQT
jgi:ribosomal protein S18 acetylase RimI-like enzyme